MPNRIRQRPGALLRPLALTLLLPVLTGCLSHTRSVQKHRKADVVLDATLDQLIKRVDDRYDDIDSMTASVQIVACTGSNLSGSIKCYVPAKGYIVISKPQELHLIILTPLVGTRFVDMVSDGKVFQMLIPIESCAISGSDTVVNTSQKGLYSLRPGMILDSMLVRGMEAKQIVSRTQDIRVIENPKKKNDLIEEPDYDLEFLSQPQDQVARTLHVVHISRGNLLPYQQDIYNDDGKVATQAFYSDYLKFGDIDFPSKIEIKRPLDELSLSITVNKGTNFNQKLDADAFVLGPVPESYVRWNMDDPASPAKNPCTSHEPQSPH